MGGKGGGGRVDTSGVNQATNLMENYADLAKQYAQANMATGQNLLGYETPVLDMYKRLVANPGQYTDPNFNMMMGLPLQQGQQAADAATKNLMNMGLGPIATQTGKQQIDLAKMANAQTGALQNVQTMLTALLGAGQQGTALMGQVPGQVTQAGGLVGQAGGLQAQLAQLQAYAQQQRNQSMMQGLQGIGTIAGMLGGAVLGGPFGAGIGGALGGLAGGAAGGGGVSNPSGYDAYMPQAMGAGGFGYAQSPYTY